ncbi:MAG: hypothetical protein HQL66_15375 [Magnetococcales bacterium]|nr:hypothetical protein [Magnetococcales bacterium]
MVIQPDAGPHAQPTVAGPTLPVRTEGQCSCKGSSTTNRKSRLEGYALNVCFVSVVSIAICLIVAAYGLVVIAKPEIGFSSAEYASFQSNDAFWHDQPAHVSVCIGVQRGNRPDEPELTRQRLEAYATRIKTKRHEKVLSAIVAFIAFVVSSVIFAIHWRIGKKVRSLATARHEASTRDRPPSLTAKSELDCSKNGSVSPRDADRYERLPSQGLSMVKSIVEKYALTVCFFSLLVFTISLNTIAYDLVVAAHPAFGFNRFSHPDLVSNDAFWKHKESSIVGENALWERKASPCSLLLQDVKPIRPSESLLTKQRQEALTKVAETERGDRGRAIVKESVVLLISAGVFAIHWLIARRVRDAASLAT